MMMILSASLIHAPDEFWVLTLMLWCERRVRRESARLEIIIIMTFLFDMKNSKEIVAPPASFVFYFKYLISHRVCVRAYAWVQSSGWANDILTSNEIWHFLACAFIWLSVNFWLQSAHNLCLRFNSTWNMNFALYITSTCELKVEFNPFSAAQKDFSTLLKSSHKITWNIHISTLSFAPFDRKVSSLK